MNSVIFYEICDNDVTTLLWPHLIFWQIIMNFAQHSYFKLQAHIVREPFFILDTFFEKIKIYYEI